MVSRRRSSSPLIRVTSRKTVADHIRDSFAYCGRKSYYHRIIYIVKHSTDDNFFPDLRKIYNNIIREIKRYNKDDVLAGFILCYSGYSIHMLEGSEGMLSSFMKIFSQIQGELFAKARVIIMDYNIIELFFRKIIWRTANSTVLLVPLNCKNAEDVEELTTTISTKIYDLFPLIAKDVDIDSSEVLQLRVSSAIIKCLPEALILDAVMDTEFFLTLKQFSDMYEAVPKYSNHDETVWPVTNDLISKNIFAKGDFDVNLRFEEPTK